MDTPPISTDTAEKRLTLERLLESDFALVHLDSRKQEVAVPQHLENNPALTLKLSRWFRGPLIIQDSYISAELLFNDIPYTCRLPWESIWGMTSEAGERFIFPLSLPQEFAKEFEKMSKQAPPQERPPDAVRNIEQPVAGKRKSGSRPVHLKRVK